MWWKQIIQFCNEQADLASVGGLIIGVGGFIVTIWLLTKSKSAAEAAKSAANKTMGSVRRVLAVTDITSAINVAQEIKRLQRENAWRAVPDRYARLKSLLIRIREENPNLTGEEKKKIQACMSQITTLESTIEKALIDSKQEKDTVKWNRILSRVLETLETLAVSVKFKQGDTP